MLTNPPVTHSIRSPDQGIPQHILERSKKVHKIRDTRKNSKSKRLISLLAYSFVQQGDLENLRRMYRALFPHQEEGLPLFLLPKMKKRRKKKMIRRTRRRMRRRMIKKRKQR